MWFTQDTKLLDKNWRNYWTRFVKKEKHRSKAREQQTELEARGFGRFHRREPAPPLRRNQVTLHKNNDKRDRRMAIFKLEILQTCLRSGLCDVAHWGSLQLSPRHHSWIRGRNKTILWKSLSTGLEFHNIAKGSVAGAAPPPPKYALGVMIRCSWLWSRSRGGRWEWCTCERSSAWHRWGMPAWSRSQISRTPPAYRCHASPAVMCISTSQNEKPSCR